MSCGWPFSLLVAVSMLLVSCGRPSEPMSVVDDSVVASDPFNGSTSGTHSQGTPTLERVTELEEPVDVASRAGDPAVYVVSRTGRVFRLLGDELASEPVLDVSDLTESGGERGLLGLGFSPDGSVAYVNFTDLAGDTVIASIDIAASGVFDRESMRVLLTIEQPYGNHNGGDLVVEPSGTLLVATGDGGSADDPQRTSLDPSSRLGKVLRIEPDTGAVRTLAKGLRNPWRIDLHDDRLWLADVGQNRWEEVSVLDAVSMVTEVVDFGWSAWEANERFNTDQSSPAHVPPLVAYQHGDDGCSISGGVVATTGVLAGDYVFADYCSGRVWSIDTDDPSPEMVPRFTGVDSPVAVVRAHDDLYVLSLSGTVWRIVG